MKLVRLYRALLNLPRACCSARLGGARVKHNLVGASTSRGTHQAVNLFRNPPQRITELLTLYNDMADLA